MKEILQDFHFLKNSHSFLLKVKRVHVYNFYGQIKKKSSRFEIMQVGGRTQVINYINTLLSPKSYRKHIADQDQLTSINTMTCI